MYLSKSVFRVAYTAVISHDLLDQEHDISNKLNYTDVNVKHEKELIGSWYCVKQLLM